VDSGFALIWIGALLIIAGVIYAASQALWRGRLSDARLSRTENRQASLEPQQSPRSFSLMIHWPAIALILLGTIFIMMDMVL
jgi:hypothetical protein